MTNKSEALVLSVAFAEFGDEDSRISTRRGQETKTLTPVPSMSIPQLGELVIKFIASERPDSITVSGGLLCCGLIDYLRGKGYEVNATWKGDKL